MATVDGNVDVSTKAEPVQLPNCLSVSTRQVSSFSVHGLTVSRDRISRQESM